MSSLAVISKRRDTVPVRPALPNPPRRRQTWHQAEELRVDRNYFRYYTSLMAPHLADFFSGDAARAAPAADRLAITLPFLGSIRSIISNSLTDGTYHDPAMAKLLRDYLTAMVPGAKPHNISKKAKRCIVRAGPDHFLALLGENNKLPPQTRHVVEYFFVQVRFVAELSKSRDVLDVVWAQAPLAPPLTEWDEYEPFPTRVCPNPNRVTLDIRGLLWRGWASGKRNLCSDYGRIFTAATLTGLCLGLSGVAWMCWAAPYVAVVFALMGAVAAGVCVMAGIKRFTSPSAAGSPTRHS